MSKREDLNQFWSLSADQLLKQLASSRLGLSTTEAKRRLKLYGPNRLYAPKRTDVLTLLLAQFKSPLILILLGAVILSFFLREPVDAAIIIAIILLSGVLGFWQEKRAADAVKNLLAIVRIEVRVIRVANTLKYILHDNKRELRKHVQHGRRGIVPSFSTAPSQANPSE